MKNNLKVERAMKNLTQEDLARLIELNRQPINAIEANNHVPSIVLSLKIARVGKKSLRLLFCLPY